MVRSSSRYEPDVESLGMVAGGRMGEGRFLVFVATTSTACVQ